jgi:excisionase family DNA binding protein
MPRLSDETLHKRAHEGSEKPAVRTRPSAAHKLNVHPRTIDRLIRRGKLKGVKIGARMMIDDASIDDLIASGGA